MPESGTPAAIGYAEESGIPYGTGLVKNSYVGRTFIQPSQTIRQLGIRLKLNPLRDVIEGKRLVVVDDSIVRGNTQRALVRMLREAGAREVHVRISSPPVKWPCFYGIDFATRAELIANGLTTEEICRSIDADSLGYISLEQLVEATNGRRSRHLCRACFDGVYPVALPEPEHLGKHLLELDPVLPLELDDADRVSLDARRRRRRRARPAVTRHPASRRLKPRCTDEPDQQASATLRGRRGLHRRRRQGRRADEGVGRQGPPPRDGRRHRRLRRASSTPARSRPTTTRCWPPRADGVGTKVAIAQAMDMHHTIGFDLVGMLVDDLVVCGAEPLFLTDYIATGRVVPERIAAIVQGIAEACVQAGCALIGGETAEHPGLLEPDEYDVAGSTTGVVEAAELLGPGRVRAGDVVIAMASSGLHSNGYSLVRHVLLWRRRRLVAGPARRRARPHARRGAARADDRIYAKACLDLARNTADPCDVARHRRRARGEPRAGAPGHGGGDPRPGDLDARSRSSTWCAGWVASNRPPWSAPSTAASGWSRVTAAERRRPGPDPARRARHRAPGCAARCEPGDRTAPGDGSPVATRRHAGQLTRAGEMARNPGPGVREQPRARYGWAHDKLQVRPDARVHVSRHRTTNRRCRSDVTPAKMCEGVDPMGRGRAKAKQTKVARDLKYRSHETDFGALAQELHGDDHKSSDTVDPVDGTPTSPRTGRTTPSPAARTEPPSPRCTTSSDPVAMATRG